MKKNLLYLSLAGLLALSGCAGQKQLNSSYTYKTECLGAGFDGSQTVIAYSDKRNREDAIEEAKKVAIREILFSGLREGKPDCDVKPILNEANAYANHEEYFNRFFTSAYKTFVLFIEERAGQKAKQQQRLKNVAQSTGYVLKISRPALQQKMIADGILTN
ncbi:hypothetical protein [Mucilaginibacter aquariorum]|uniref:Uncharacterized protein n=1 Tax=Mucilaginibacter aquariorum TaxID=2967225 RepID=A0ABT1T4F4_9SPHI|nr:hypothetical protein [Mucilaginibacter aquariorum]MCQ6959484.1 hypothetical protein [Mucilaginibacter aquariorum]